jgi:hypothetical protein
MKKNENQDAFEEIGEMLRSSRGPEASPSPGLEGRILRGIEATREREKTGWRWSWFLLPAVGTAAVLFLLSGPPGKKPPVRPVAESKVHVPAMVRKPVESVADLYEGNPLKVETLALQRDANRAEGFLWECLPTFGGLD